MATWRFCHIVSCAVNDFQEIICFVLLFAMTLFFLHLGIWEWVLSTNGKCSKSLFIPALVSEGHEKTQRRLLAETLVCCDSAQSKVHLGLSTCWDAWKAIHSPPGAFTPDAFLCGFLRAINGKENNINMIWWCVFRVCDRRHHRTCHSSGPHPYFLSLTRRNTKAQRHSLVSAEHRAGISRQLWWGVLRCQRLVSHFIFPFFSFSPPVIACQMIWTRL